jgi:hypothetical protein
MKFSSLFFVVLAMVSTFFASPVDAQSIAMNDTVIVHDIMDHYNAYFKPYLPIGCEVEFRNALSTANWLPNLIDEAAENGWPAVLTSGNQIYRWRVEIEAALARAGGKVALFTAMKNNDSTEVSLVSSVFFVTMTDEDGFIDGPIEGHLSEFTAPKSQLARNTISEATAVVFDRMFAWRKETFEAFDTWDDLRYYIHPIALAINGYGEKWTPEKAYGQVPRYLDSVPVELSSFKVRVIGSSVRLNWRTETETVNLGFSVERSSNKGRTWSPIGWVKGNGTTVVPREYDFTDTDPGVGEKLYRLVQQDFDGTRHYLKPVKVFLRKTPIVQERLLLMGESGEVGEAMPRSFTLHQNFPNPFNPATTISFDLPETGFVRLTVYNQLGQLVQTLVSEVRDAGSHSIQFVGAGLLPSGIYIYRIKTENHTASKTMTLVR